MSASALKRHFVAAREGRTQKPWVFSRAFLAPAFAGMTCRLLLLINNFIMSYCFSMVLPISTKAYKDQQWFPFVCSRGHRPIEALFLAVSSESFNQNTAIQYWARRGLSLILLPWSWFIPWCFLRSCMPDCLVWIPHFPIAYTFVLESWRGVFLLKLRCVAWTFFLITRIL